MKACKTMVAGVFLALAFFIGAGEAQAQYRPTGGNNGFNQAYQSPFAKTPPPNYVWRNGNGQTMTSTGPIALFGPGGTTTANSPLVDSRAVAASSHPGLERWPGRMPG